MSSNISGFSITGSGGNSIVHRCLQTVKALEHSLEDGEQTLVHLAELTAIANEADYLRCHLQLLEAKTTLERLILATIWQILRNSYPSDLDGEVKKAILIIEVGEKLHLGLSLAKAQELYYTYLHETLIPLCIQGINSHNNGANCPWELSHLESLLDLGKTLGVDITNY